MDHFRTLLSVPVRIRRSIVIYQVGTVLTGGAVNPVGLVAAAAIVAFFVYMLVRPYKESETLSVDTKNLVKSK